MQTRSEALNEIAKVITETIINVLDKNLRSCLNCNYFSVEKEMCWKYNQRPPAKVIAKGCDAWIEYDGSDIPF